MYEPQLQSSQSTAHQASSSQQNSTANQTAQGQSTVQQAPANQGTLKVFAPVITHDVTLPNTSKKVPMVMVPVPDSRTLMAIPISTLSHLKDSQINVSKDEQQARDLLVWNDGIGTLNGCDLQFKINQLGCLELIDSDDESENQNISKKHSTHNRNNSDNFTTNKDATNGLASDTSYASEPRLQKRVKMDNEPLPIRQISPGSSLLRDGPDIRRPKSVPGSSLNSFGRPQGGSLSLLKKIGRNQYSAILEQLVPKERLDEIKQNIESWTTEDVRVFVDNIPGCAGYGELFESQQICGKSLLYLDQRDLLDVINVKLGPAVKIYHAISLLK